jgi:acyl-CoA dehydrogenase
MRSGQVIGVLLPPELVQLRETVRRFMEDEVRPIEARLPHDAAGIPAEYLKPLQAKARALGLWSMQTPEKFGGAGLSALGQVVVAEEASKCRMGAFFAAGGAFGGNPPNVLFQATLQQFEKYARPIIEGKASRAYTAISEPSGGSDPARAIRCTAIRDGDRYILNGTKTWITHAATADWGVVYARATAGITCFIVERSTPGLTIKPIEVMTSYSPYELHFDNASIPVEARIGEEGRGFALAQDFLVHGRIVYAAGTIGIAQYALELAVDWVKQREVFGSTLASKQGIQWMIADSAIELQAARLLTYEAARKVDQGDTAKVDASMCKLFATESAFKIVDRCMQLFGGLGMAKDMPFERWFRELRIKRLGEGATEVQRNVVARAILGAA